MKTISDLYLGAYLALANKQHAKYGNPTAEQSPAPTHVSAVLEAAVQNKTLTTDQARKLASVMGKLAYGEYGLTPGRVGGAIDKVCGFGVLHWQKKMELETRLCGY